MPGNFILNKRYKILFFLTIAKLEHLFVQIQFQCQKLYFLFYIFAGMVDSILDNFEDNFSAKRKGRRIWFRISGTDEEFETWNNQIHVWVNQEKVEYAHWQVETEPKYGLHIQGLIKFSKQIGPTTIASYFQGYANFDWGNLLNDQDYKQMKGYCTREQTRVRHGQTYGEDENESRAAKADIVRGLVDQIRSDGKIPARTLWFAQRKSVKTWKSAVEQYNAEESAVKQNRLYEEAKFIVWKPWQQYVVEHLKVPIDPRCILVILDKTGNAGKTFLMSKWKILNEEKVCNLNNGKTSDLMHILSKKPLCDTILVNIPRSPCGRVNYQALEQAKDGEFISTKYDGAEKSMGPTRMVIFTNEPLNWDALSKDRWQILTIQGEKHEYHVQNYVEYKTLHGTHS